MHTNASLENLQTDDQRRVLDAVSQIRKCGLESVLSLPQIVVCGDQSSGKSSLLEALTEIPFPRNDNLCTRFATEISLRREPNSSLTIRIIPDSSRPTNEQDAVKMFSESITDLKDLPAIMDHAMKVMGISEMESTGSAFAKDILSIEIEGPDRPQLSLVDIPGLIQASTKGVSEADVATVAEITNSYIKQPRTICLAVVSATNDAANQPILQHVRKVDPRGERTLGVITKPDRLSAGSGSEAKFLELARNDDVFFTLGWHVIKNRKFEESAYSIEERNVSEMTFFSTSNFKTLPKEDVGIDALRVKLSHLLLEHVKKELPRLQEDLEAALKSNSEALKTMGESRSTIVECRAFLARLNMECYEICKASLTGNYEHDYFKKGIQGDFSLASEGTIARIRAAIQYANNEFSTAFRKRGHKYHICSDDNTSTSTEEEQIPKEPQVLSKKEALAWVRTKLLLSRGTELIGNFNPDLIAELFWEQSEGWGKLAKAHVEQISKLCRSFLSDLLDVTAPDDLKKRIWHSLIQDTLAERHKASLAELDKLLKDRKDFPINYNHYYTDTVYKKRQERIKTQIGKHLPKDSHTSTQRCSVGDHYPRVDYHRALTTAVGNWADKVTTDMEKLSCEEALDCLLSIYKVQQKTFVANVVTQVIERHVVHGLNDIFSPMVAISLSENDLQNIISEPRATKTRRLFLADRVKRLQVGQEIIHEIINL